MAYLKTNASDDTVYTPLVLTTRKFLEHWSASLITDQATLARGSEPTWRTDRKFHLAEDRFRESARSPVPFAELAGCWLRPPTPTGAGLWARLRRRQLTEKETVAAATLAVSLDNGVTRTLWLLANGADVVPFDCSSELADDIDQRRGPARWR